MRLWALHRLGALTDPLAARLLDDPASLVRVHIVKAMAERPDWKTEKLPLAKLVRQKLSDADPVVRRAAAEALGLHPELENVKPLAELWSHAPAEDTHLIHTVRIALRNQLADKGMYAALAAVNIPGENRELRRRMADVSLGVPSAESAAFLLLHFREKPGDVGQLGETAHHAVRYLKADQLPDLYAALNAWRAGGNDFALQRDVLRGAEHGLQERGVGEPARELRSWAAELTVRFLKDPHDDQIASGIELAREFQCRRGGGPDFTNRRAFS